MGVANVGLHVGLSRERKGESENDERGGETKCSRFFAVVGARLEWWWIRACLMEPLRRTRKTAIAGLEYKGWILGNAVGDALGKSRINIRN
jgi:hypothetical protein